MSASREKKIRQELAASGIPDIKDIRAAEERKQQRRANWLYGSIAVVFVLVAAALLVWNSNIIQRSSTAISVDGENYSAAEVGYYYYNAYNSVANSQYAAYMSLDTSSPLRQQVMTENDYLFMGITPEEGEEDLTWHQYFTDAAKTTLRQVTMLLKAADEAQFSFTDEMQAEMDSTMESLETYAQQAGVSTASYLKSLFGSNMTTNVFQKILKDNILASYYEQSYIDSLKYTDEEIENYYAENKDSFDTVDYDYIYFKGTASSTTDADGNTVAATDEEQAAAKDAAKAAADDALARYQAGETDLEALAEDYEMASFYSLDESSNYSDTISTWLFDEARQSGDTDVLESGSSYYLVHFNSRSRYDYNTVNIRHILCKVDDSALDTSADDYETKLEELKKEQEAEANAIYQEWKDAGSTIESFTELAAKYSNDPGSSANGGLYTQVYKNQMVTEFNDWCFDESRQAGDSAIVYAESTGYHIMYFDGFDDPYWKVQVTSALSNADYSEWSAALVEGVEVEEHSGMKYVG